jgi:hypothetical protein
MKKKNEYYSYNNDSDDEFVYDVDNECTESASVEDLYCGIEVCVV